MSDVVLDNRGLQRSFFNRNDVRGDDRAPAFQAPDLTRVLSALERHFDRLVDERAAAAPENDSGAVDAMTKKIASLQSDIEKLRQLPPGKRP